LIDTNITDNSEQGVFKAGEVYSVTNRSLLLLVLIADKP